MKALAILLLLLPQASPPQAESAEVYALYSAMITNRMTQPRAADQIDPIYLIDSSTVTDSGGPGCVKAPAQDTAALAEVVADYNRRSNVSATLEKQFTLPKPYELLERDKAARFLQDALEATPQFLPRGGVPPVNQNPLYAKAKNVIRFSEVYFDKSRTFALAWVAIYSTSVDYMGAWRPYRKSSNGVWEENRSWTPCGRGQIR